MVLPLANARVSTEERREHALPTDEQVACNEYLAPAVGYLRGEMRPSADAPVGSVKGQIVDEDPPDSVCLAQIS